MTSDKQTDGASDLELAMGDDRAEQRLRLLELVAEHGSISQAARVAGVSYKMAWQSLHRLSELAGRPVISSSVGGSGGGGARLLPAGERLLQAASLLRHGRYEALQRTGKPVGTRSSMRNLLRCRVGHIAQLPGDPLARVELVLDGGGRLESLITCSSLQRMNLQVPQRVLALCKAAAVRMVGEKDPGLRPPDGCLLAGQVLRQIRGASQDEITLALAGGQEITGFAAAPNGFEPGAPAVAAIDPRIVVLALPD